MRFFGTRSALVAGAMSLAVAAGAVGIFATERAGAAFAQDNESEYEGIVETLPATGTAGEWRVSGRTIFVSDTTEIDTNGQTLAPGLRVEIEGDEQPDGSIVAREIEVDDDVSDDDDTTGAASPGDDDDDDGPDGAPAPLLPVVPGGPVAADDDDGGAQDGQRDDDDGDSSEADDDDDSPSAPAAPGAPLLPGVPGLPGNPGADDDD